MDLVDEWEGEKASAHKPEPSTMDFLAKSERPCHHLLTGLNDETTREEGFISRGASELYTISPSSLSPCPSSCYHCASSCPIDCLITSGPYGCPHTLTSLLLLLPHDDILRPIGGPLSPSKRRSSADGDPREGESQEDGDR